MATRRIEGDPVAADEAALHLERFADAFVVPHWRERAKTFFSRPRRDGLRWHEIAEWIDPALKREVHIRWNEVPAEVAPHLDTLGIYIDPYEALRMPLSRALAEGGASMDAIFSIVPGAYAFFLHHESWVYQCGAPLLSRKR